MQLCAKLIAGLLLAVVGDAILALHLAEKWNERRLTLPAQAANHRPDFADLLRKIAPLIASDSFSRLRKITFLGILSPMYANIDYHPIRFQFLISDRSRAHHSFRVALLAGKMAEHLSLSTETIRYAILWGLLHDIATWPLSHTGEAAFSSATSTSAGKLRRMMITGDNALNRSLCVFRSLKEIGADIDLLLTLFDKGADFGTDELAHLHQLLHSTLTPDTLEGMYRSGSVFGLSVPAPKDFIGSMERDLISGIRLKHKYSETAIKFWRAKGKIYSNFINKEETVAFESSWSSAIRSAYSNIDLSESLLAGEGDIIRNVSCGKIRPSRDVVRYKAPLIYHLSDKYSGSKKFKDSLPLGLLSEVFVKDMA